MDESTQYIVCILQEIHWIHTWFRILNLWLIVFGC
jgi:hypothetical protein